jgi:hypothetical protein
MRKPLTTLWKRIRSIVLSEEAVLLLAYFALLFLLTFGFDVLYTIWKAIIG